MIVTLTRSSNLFFPVRSDMIPSDGLDKRIRPAALRRNQDQDLPSVTSHAKNATEQKVHIFNSVRLRDVRRWGSVVRHDLLIESTKHEWTPCKSHCFCTRGMRQGISPATDISPSSARLSSDLIERPVNGFTATPQTSG
jgi:hypothetical protein